MTNTYNTGNALGSTDPRDLLDNASNLDDGMNSALPTFTDRLGVSRDTWSGQEAAFDLSQAGREAEFQAFLVSSGFISLGNYAAGISVTAYNEYVAFSGFFYRPAASSIPFVTSGTWVGDDENKFVLLSPEDVLRQDLADDIDDAMGAALVGWRNQTVGSLLDGLLLTELDPTGVVSIDSVLQAALTANDVVVLPAGDFKLSSKMTLKSRNVLRGQGMGATRIFRDTVVPAFDFFEGITVDGVLVEDIFFDSVAKLGVSVDANRHCALRFWDNDTNNRSKRITVRGCRFEKFTSAEIQPEGSRGVIAVDQCDDILIYGNRFFDNRATTVFYFDTADIIVANNYFVGEQAPFDLVFQPTQGLGSFCSGGSQGSLIIGNRAVQSGYTTINAGGSGCTVSGNIIRSPSYSGITLNESVDNDAVDVVVSGNSIFGAQLSSISVFNVERFNISGNTLSGSISNQGNIRLNVTPGGAKAPKRGVISGNLIQGAVAGAGIRANAGQEIDIRANRFAGNVSGIYVEAIDVAQAVELTVSGNTFKDNTNYAIEMAGTGLAAQSVECADNVISSSNIATLQPTGFVVNGAVSTMVFGRNTFSNNYVINLVETVFANRATKAVLQLSAGVLTRMKLLDSLNYINTAVYDPASLADGVGVTTTVSVPGAALGDMARASFSISLQGVLMQAWVSAANVVSVRFQNETGGIVDLASGTITAQVIKL